MLTMSPSNYIDLTKEDIQNTVSAASRPNSLALVRTLSKTTQFRASQIVPSMDRDSHWHWPAPLWPSFRDSPNRSGAIVHDWEGNPQRSTSLSSSSSPASTSILMPERFWQGNLIPPSNPDDRLETPYSRLSSSGFAGPERRQSSYNLPELPHDSNLPPKSIKVRSTPVRAENDQDIIDLTIQDIEKSFPIRKANVSSSKRRHHNISEDQPVGSMVPSLHSVFADGDYMTDEQFEKSFAALAFETPARGGNILRSSAGRKPINSVQKANRTYKVGKTAQLKDGTFLRIRTIWEEPNGETVLVGYLLMLENSLELLMPKRRNELVWLNEPAKEEFERGMTSKIVEIRLDQVERIRKVIFTNQRYPNVSLQDCAERLGTAAEDVELGPLFCRWKRVKVQASRYVLFEDSLSPLTCEEADEIDVQNARHNSKISARIDTETVRKQWRGNETIVDGSHVETLRTSQEQTTVVDLEDAMSTHRPPSKIQKYTYGDAFCGAGGASRGALQAGLHITWAFDMAKEAMKSYVENFEQGGTACMQTTVTDFLKDAHLLRFMVDVCHMSPPCKPFSPAHTVPSQERDEMNQAALFSIWHLTESIKPRVATVEETEGLFSRHHEWFSAVIMIFTSMGYGVRWKIINCKDYGVPQPRKRLCIIAAG